MAANKAVVVNASGAIVAPVSAATFRNNNGLQIGLNIQAWSASLDSAATHISWSGSNPTFASEIIATSSITTTTGNVIVPSGDVITGGGVFADTLSVDAITATGDVILTGTFDFSGATGTLGYGQGGTNATTLAGARTNLGGMRYGFADTAAIQAATPEFIGQLLMAIDGSWGRARGTSAGAVDMFAVVTNGQTNFSQPVHQFSSSTVYIDRMLHAGFGGGNYEHWLKNNGGDNVVNVQNSHASWYSAVCLWTSDGLKVGAMGMANPSSATTLRDKLFFHGNTYGAGRFATIPPIVQLGQDFSYSAGGFVSHGFLQCKAGDGGKFGTGIYGLHATNPLGSIGLWVNEDARVGVATDTLSSGAKLTVAGELHTNGSGSALRFYSQNGDGGFYQWYSDTLSNGYLQSSANGIVWTYNATSNEHTAAYGLKANGYMQTASYTVAGAGALAATAGRIIYVSNESGGAVLAFGDGTNWRRCTDRAIIS